MAWRLAEFPFPAGNDLALLFDRSGCYVGRGRDLARATLRSPTLSNAEALPIGRPSRQPTAYSASCRRSISEHLIHWNATLHPGGLLRICPVSCSSFWKALQGANSQPKLASG
jgi:hypothetical protein